MKGVEAGHVIVHLFALGLGQKENDMKLKGWNQSVCRLPVDVTKVNSMRCNVYRQSVVEFEDLCLIASSNRDSA
jgi:hypothetical protein